MATEFGLCPTCGAPKIAADQGFCGACGSMMPDATPVAPIAPADPQAVRAEPPAWASYPPAYAAAPSAPSAPPVPDYSQSYAQGYPPAPQGYAPSYPPAPQGYAPSYPPAPQGYAPGYPPAPQGYPQGYAGYPQGYAAPRRINPAFLLIGVVLAMAAIALVVVLIVTSRNGSSGGITFSPANYECGAAYEMTMRLPASLNGSDKIQLLLDGTTVATINVSDDFHKQTDGSWLYTYSEPKGNWSCDPTGADSAGTHTMKVVDVTGKVLAQGSYTVKQP